MNANEIIKVIADRQGITTLNSMQQDMLQRDARAIILISPTGTGKTLAFACRLLKNLNAPAGKVQAVVIAPSRELVMQIQSVIRPIATGYKTVALYGGHSMTDEQNSLHPCPDIIIATPGRLLDHIQRGHLEIDGTEMLVLDEYDKSLELGFEGEMKRIVRRLGRIHNIILTSATPLETLPEYLHAGQCLTLDYTPESEKGRRTEIVEVESFSRDKLDTLVGLLGHIGSGQRIIVFVNHRESAERVYQRLCAEHLPAILYHGALDQHQREMAIDLFANGSAPILVATDLAARGLDISQVTDIVHYHLPVDHQAWTHRNGRTARVDASGTVWVIRSEADNIPEYISFDRKYIPSGTAKTSSSILAPLKSLYISSGKKEKISKGDIAGFIAASGLTAPGEIGMISVHDHHSVAAVPAGKAAAIARVLSELKLKGHKTRVSVVRDLPAARPPKTR